MHVDPGQHEKAYDDAAGSEAEDVSPESDRTDRPSSRLRLADCRAKGNHRHNRVHVLGEQDVPAGQQSCASSKLAASLQVL